MSLSECGGRSIQMLIRTSYNFFIIFGGENPYGETASLCRERSEAEWAVEDEVRSPYSKW